MNYNEIARQNLDALMKEIAEYTRLSEEVSAILDGLRDTLKTYMTENGLDTVTGSEHKASYKKVTSSRLDLAALKKELPKIAAKYTEITETRRLLFV